jgi:hypothetical protein
MLGFQLCVGAITCAASALSLLLEEEKEVDPQLQLKMK